MYNVIDHIIHVYTCSRLGVLVHESELARIDALEETYIERIAFAQVRIRGERCENGQAFQKKVGSRFNTHQGACEGERKTVTGRSLGTG